MRAREAPRKTRFIPSPLAAMLAAALLLSAALAQAQTTYTVPNGVPFTDPSVTPTPVPAAPADGSTITLQGGASITSQIQLPTGGSPDLTINAASGGSTITIGANMGSALYNGTANPITLNVSGGDLTFTGANSTQFMAGGVIGAPSPSGGGPLTINATNGLAFTNNAIASSGASGGAIFTIATVAITAGGDVNFTGNSEKNAGGGGAIEANGGVTISSGGAITMNDNVATGGNSGNAILALSNSVSLKAASNIVIDNNNSGTSFSYAIQAGGGGSVTIDSGGFIEMLNDGTNAIVAGNGVNLTAAGDITISNNGSSGLGNSGGAIYANHSPDSGIVSLVSTTGNITLSDNYAFRGGAIMAIGNVSLNAAGTLTLTGNTASSDTIAAINDHGGAILSEGDDTTLSGSTITLSSNQAIGNGGGVGSYSTTLTLTGALTASGNSAGLAGGAIYAISNVTLNATTGDITFSGNTQNTAATAQANAIYLNNTPAATTTTLTLNAQGYPITFDDPIQNNPANGLITVMATGGNTVIFDGASQAGNAANRQSLIDGATEVTSGTTFAVRNNAVYGALAAEVTGGAASSFTVDSNATLAGGTTFANGTSAVHADTFTLNGTLNIAGNDAPGTAAGKQASFSQFTVSSSGTDTLTGGTVVFNTCLNDAATQLSDQLALNLNGGTTTGTATIQVNPVTTGCVGALTQGNGILLVNVSNGATTADAFKLAAPVVAANGYTYSLKQASDGNWYLQGAAPLNDGINGGTVPTPIDARWMLGLIGLLLASFGTRAMRRA